MKPDWFYVMIISVASIWAGVAIVRIIVDGVVKTKQARAEIEREYLGQMMAELQEIKARLEAAHPREQEDQGAPR